MKRLLVIYSPVAGRGRVREEWPAVDGALRQAGVTFDAVATTAPLEAGMLAREAADKYAGIVGVGGDETIHEIVNGLMQASAGQETLPVGVVALGSGDDFAKVLPPEAPIGGKSFDWRLAVAKIVEGRPRLFDVGRTSSRRPMARFRMSRLIASKWISYRKSCRCLSKGQASSSSAARVARCEEVCWLPKASSSATAAF